MSTSKSDALRYALRILRPATELDTAVADAYGWGDDWRAGRLYDDEILARLFALNQARSR